MFLSHGKQESVLQTYRSDKQQKGKPRSVPAFSTESRQKNTKIVAPPKIDQSK